MAGVVLPVAAQYSGGTYDGTSYAISSCAPALIYKGGSYDGFSNISVFCWNSTSAQYTGGQGDGVSGQNNSSCNNVADVSMGGGNDGVALATSGSCNPGIYGGGANDGVALASSTSCAQPDVAVGGSNDGTGVATATCTVTGPYAGGANDGVSAIAINCTSANIYTGGTYDGTSYALSACGNGNIYLGGPYDGTSYQVSACAANPSIAVGGSYDGFSNASVSCSATNVYVGGSYDGASYQVSACPTNPNLYAGGSYDGVSYSKYSCPASNIYAGGSYDGFSDVTVFCWNSTSAQYTGGSYDGVSGQNVACSAVTVNVANGGSNDGVSLATTGSCSPGIYAGGSNDGVSLATAGSCPATTNIYMGGNNDGVSLATTGVCPSTANVYTGGSNDGVSLATLACSNPNNIFKGGTYDGTSFLATSCTSPNIYAGGSYDGFSYIQTSCPPTASIFKGGSYDGAAYSLKSCSPSPNLYAGGSYDGFSYYVTACCTPPSITQQPVNDSVCAGATATFSLNASSISGTITYQWQENRGSGWNNITAGGIYGSPSTTSLTLTGVPKSMNGYQYRCLLTVACGAFTFSNVDTLKVDQLSASTTTVTACAGTSINLNPSPTGQTGSIVSNAWSINNAGTTGATSSNLTNASSQTVTFNTTGLSAGTALLGYTVTDSKGCSVSVIDTVNLNAIPNLSNFYIPSATACEGGQATVNLFSNSLPNGTYNFSYIISGNNSLSGTASVVFDNNVGQFTTTGILPDSGQTKVVITTVTLQSTGCSTNLNGTDSLWFSVGTPPTIISYSPGSFSNTVCAGSNTFFTVNAIGTALTYGWQVSTNGGATWASIGDSGVYTGTSTATLNIATQPSLDGDEFRAIVTGQCPPADTTIAGLLHVGSVNINTEPNATTYACAGDTGVIWIIAAGTNLGYQWQYSSNSGSTWTNLVNNSVYSGVSTDSLILIASSGIAGYEYRCVVNTLACNPDTSSPSVLSLTSAPAITTYSPPSFNDTVCSGTVAAFSINATGSGLSYQWQLSVNGGTTWSNLSNGGGYAGVTTSSLGITTVASMNLNQYRCVINGACSPADTSNPGTLNVGAISISSQPPTNTHICSGTNGSISVGVSGNFLSYQWQVSTNGGSTWSNLSNTAPYSNVTTSTLNITGATSALNGYDYRCVISTLVCSSVNSNYSTLSIYIAPNITSTQYNDVICAGSNASFTVTATGTPAPTYQWMFNGSNISGATSATYTVNAATSANAGIYGVVVSNACASDTVYDTLTVNTAPSITSYSPSSFIDTVCAGGTAYFSIATSGSGLTYQWQVSTNSGSTWTNVSNGAVYSGVTTDSLAIITASSMDGYYYRCQVFSASCGTTLNSSSAILHIGAVSITTQPAPSTSICSGNNGTITVAASGTYLKYQWQVSINGGTTWSSLSNVAPYSGVTTNTLSLTAVTTSLNGYLYRAVISTLACVGDTSGTSTLTINTAPAITAYSPASLNDTVCAGTNATLSVTATGTALTYQWQVSTNSGGSWSNASNGATYSGVTTNVLGIVTTAAMNGYYYRVVVSGTCTPAVTSSNLILHVGSVNISTQPPASTTICNTQSGTITLTATGNTLGYQWQVSTNSGSTWTNLTNTAPYSGVTTTTLTLTSVTTSLNGYQYRCFITSPGCVADTSNVSTLTINLLPAVTGYNPASLNDTVCAGSVANFAITATGTSITYQWQVSTNSGGTWSNVSNGSTYSGVTTNSLAITTTAAMNLYYYRCVVSGACTPAATSNSFILHVGSVSITTQPPATFSICTGNSGTTGIIISGTYLSYQWLVSTDSGNTWSVVNNGGVYSGATTSTLGLNSITSGMGGYEYKVVVSTLICPNDTSAVTTLTLAPAPAITAYNPTSFKDSVCAGGNALFSLTATNANAYQWQVSTNSGSTWSNVVNNTTYAGATTDSLAITAATAGMDGYYYRCIVQGNCLPYDTSINGILYVGAVAISSQPATTTTVCAASNTTISVGATGTHLTYQWQLSIDGGTTWSTVSNTAPYSGATTATLTITGATAGMNGSEYRCVISTIVCSPLTSNVSTLVVNTAPAITSYSPTSLIDSVCAGATATFGITATGTSLTYQWQVSTNSGVSWSNASNGATYTGVTTNTLNIVTTSAMNGYYYRVIVSGSCTPSVTSSSFILRVGAVSISTQPASTLSLCSGSNGTITLTAAGNYLSYQWQVSINGGSSWSNLSNTAPYSGVTTNTLTLTGVTTALNTYDYRCVISTIACTGDSSNTCALTVNPAPSITSYNPTSWIDTVCAGANALFAITAANTSTYQWEVSTNGGVGWSNVINNATYSGATTDSLLITGSTAAMDGYEYRCVLSNGCLPNDTSAAGTLKVGSATINTQPPSSTVVCSGLNTTISMSATGTHLTYQWQVSTDGGSTWNNVANGTLYSGATTAALTITGATAGMNGYIYRNLLSTLSCSGITSGNSTLTVNVAPSITTPPASQTVCNGTNVTFSVVATGTPAPTYQWYYGGSAISGATSSTYNINPVSPANAGNYTVSVTNSCGSVSSPTSPAVLAINNPPSITSYTPSGFANTVCAGTNTTFSVAATGAGLNYQWQVSTNGGTTWSNLSSGSGYSGVTSFTLTITARAAFDGNKYRVVVTGFCSPADTSNIGSLTVGSDSIATQPPTTTTICNTDTGTVSITATGTHLTYQWQISTNSGTSWSNLGNNSTYNNVTTNTLTIMGATTSMSGYKYRCVLSTLVCTADTSTASTLSIALPPNITAYSPVSFVNNICNSSNTFFSVTATGNGLTYQWQVSTDGVTWSNVVNGGIYSGAQTSDLGIVSSTGMDGYKYRVVVTGTCSPPDTSVTGILNVGAVAITQEPPTPVPVCVDGHVTIQAVITGTHLTYQWQVSTNGGTTWSNVINGTTYSGAATANLTVLSFSAGMNGYKYRLISTTVACSPDTSTTATLESSSTLTAIAALSGCMFEDSAHIHTSVDSNLVLVTVTGGTPPYILSAAGTGSLVDSITDSLAEYTVPANNATYTFNVTDFAGCLATSNSVMSSPSNPITIPYTSTHGFENAVCYDNGFMRWLTFVDTADKAILAIYDSSSNLGQLTVTVYKDSVTPEILQSGSSCAGAMSTAMQRHFVISSTAPQPFSHQVLIRLFFTNLELDSLEHASQVNDVPGDECTYYDDLENINGLYVTKYDDPKTGHQTENGIYSDNLSAAAGGIYKVYGTGAANGPLYKDSLGFPAIYPEGLPHHYVQLAVHEFSELWLHGSQSLAEPLPVEMLYLEAEAMDNTYIQLRWATAIEINNNRFDIERSTDGQSWTQLDSVPGHGNSSVENDYNYNDYKVVPDLRYYYRLKQVDNNGNYKYTDVVTAIITGNPTFAIKGFIPNPASSNTQLLVTSSLATEITVEFYDVLGQKLSTNYYQINQGTNTVQFATDKFSAGTYTAVITSGNAIYTKKLVITR